MAFLRDSDIEPMLAGLGGVDVVHGAETGKGLLDLGDQLVLQGTDIGVSGRMFQVTVRSNAFPTLKVRDTLVVDGVTVTVTDRVRQDDGALTQIQCSR
jgi:hypothetical protein